MEVIWFKRDLRVNDHEPLAKAKGKLLLIYIIEPSLWQQEDMSSRHYLFLLSCLNQLRLDLKKYNLNLVIKVGEAKRVFQELNANYKITKIVSHQETWNYWTYERDIQVKSWCKENSIIWEEFKQTAVIRGLKNRNIWSKNWQRHMHAARFVPAKFESIMLKSDILPSVYDLGIKDIALKSIPIGGSLQAKNCLNKFLAINSKKYSKGLSSPRTAYDSCSRISIHLAFGTISIREVVQSTSCRLIQLKSKPQLVHWYRSLLAFNSRLHWRCHFIQKLESEPSIEYCNLHPMYNEINKSIDHAKFEAWKLGKTGYPMIDACMRALIATGWLNFRMRAMLISFASNHLWLPWQETGQYLAKLFLDYEPGIHWPQIQMQSGTTGINTIRIYNPIKQGLDHDPDGEFLLKWLPELSKMPKEYLHTPWLHPQALNGYPMPIVDEKTARKFASDEIYKIKKNIEHKVIAKKIYNKHGSRKQSMAEKKVQGELPI